MKARLLSLASRFWREWLRPMALAAAVVLPLKSTFADWEWVPTGSMEPTIVPLEFVWVNKLAYDLKVPFTTMHVAEWDNPRRGEVVVFFSPADGMRLVKRVIGLPGDVVEARNDALVINGKPVRYEPEPSEANLPTTADIAAGQEVWFARELLPGRTHPVMFLPQRPAWRTFGPIRVPAGQYFLMGDDRDDSGDSRYFGCVARERIVGQATRILASFDLDHFARPRLGRFFQLLP